MTDALAASLAKWTKHSQAVSTQGVRLGTGDCPMCMVTVDHPIVTRGLERLRSCEGCPVAHYTGQPNCRDTPYSQANTEWLHVRGRVSPAIEGAVGDAFRAAAAEEVAFLGEVQRWWLEAIKDLEASENG